jgi:anti-sigma-K factor RskA
MAYSEDHIALAAEYALGTLDADERAQAEAMMSIDKDFTAMVEAWQNRLGVLNQMVGSVEPRPEVWDRIRTAVGHSQSQSPLLLPDAPPPSAQYVALLQKDSGSPAFILTVDGATRNFTVRRVGATPEPGKSYELWLVSDKLQRPRSLGVIGGNDFTTRPALASYDPDTVNKATYAVTVEPEGGSPTGVATGPIVFTGKLIEAVPPAASAPAR